MRLYLVQHGEAKSKDEDPERHLTEKGVRDVEKVAAFLAPLGLSVSAVRHSGKTRAAETAGILSGAVASADGVIAREGLAPNDPVEPVKEELARAASSGRPPRAGKTRACPPGGGVPTDRAEDDVMIVGHLPFLDRLASLLVAGSEAAGAVAFRNAGVVRLERADDGAWRTAWAVVPEILP